MLFENPVFGTRALRNTFPPYAAVGRSNGVVDTPGRSYGDVGFNGPFRPCRIHFVLNPFPLKPISVRRHVPHLLKMGSVWDGRIPVSHMEAGRPAPSRVFSRYRLGPFRLATLKVSPSPCPILNMVAMSHHPCSASRGQVPHEACTPPSPYYLAVVSRRSSPRNTLLAFRRAFAQSSVDPNWAFGAKVYLWNVGKKSKFDLGSA